MSEIETEEGLPIILEGKFFKVKTLNKGTGKVIATCLACEKKNLTTTSPLISGSLHPTSNFSTHLKVWF